MDVHNSPRIVFRADASERMGGGHVMRCLTLADALAERGATISFVAASITAGLAERVRQAGHDLHEITVPQDSVADTPDWDTCLFSEEAQRVDARQTMEVIGERGADWIVVDHYRLDRTWEEEARASAGGILVLDDLANRRHDCDVLLDHSFGRSAGDYSPHVPSESKILTGTQYILLRPEFAQVRIAAEQRRRRTGPVRRLLVTLGSTDVGAITQRAVESIVRAGVSCLIDVVLGNEAPSRPALERMAEEHEAIRLYDTTCQMAPLMGMADLAVGAGGMTMWERSCVGLPSLTLVLASNQRPSVERLAALGATKLLSDGEDVGEAVFRLLSDAAKRESMVRASFGLVDAGGAERVARTMLDQFR